MDAQTEARFWQRRFEELARQADRGARPVSSPFLSIAQQQLFLQLCPSFSLPCGLFGGFEGAERKLALFAPSEESLHEAAQTQFALLHIAPKQAKFADALSHRDFLGALLHLGLERDCLGDLLLQDQSAYLFCLKSPAALITQELSKVRHTAVRVQAAAVLPEGLAPRLQPLSHTVLSPRADAVIAAVFHLSRSAATALFPAEKVQLDGRLCTAPSAVLQPGVLVSVRGFGRFRLDEVGPPNKKGRLRLLLSLYV